MTTQAPMSCDDSTLTAADLEARLRELRGALEGAVALLARVGYSPEAYYALDDAQRESPEWRAVRRAREACGGWPEFVMRFTNGAREHARTYPSRQAALDGAIEVLEMREGYPSAIETGGRHLMSCSDILHAWEDRHDPG